VWGEELRHLLAQSVRRRLMSDVPLGVFLSGGIDSSAVLAYATQGAARGPRADLLHRLPRAELRRVGLRARPWRSIRLRAPRGDPRHRARARAGTRGAGEPRRAVRRSVDRADVPALPLRAPRITVASAATAATSSSRATIPSRR
jgi:asparagine synthetase B (glutamine-hydrolysing)